MRKPHARAAAAARAPAHSNARHKKTVSRIASMSATTLAERGGLDGEETSPPKAATGAVLRVKAPKPRRQGKAEGRRRAKTGARQGAATQGSPCSGPSAAMAVFGNAALAVHDAYTCVRSDMQGACMKSRCSGPGV